ncbi:MAG: MFS transporter [Aurantimicrobium sp.]|uniref:Major Facilitator Superfamily protein n=1 Tax=Aurantimicrobium photophilum TaxID=1987356 RepID=A0A2Z3S117_9MICO|nr:MULTISPECIES: MFS transporter [Aurantimicrobium]AWR21974.1 Major Facilitator Superfamily protein [Aurantimicrobium photophilum]MDH6256009.1 MFS family permease [Aurantimicrobium minutum]MDH6410016.1 MFS family permease [Aurantimicrobium minutum]MDH6537323.1 MFS family permease [Aurantimicrobium minutum]
MKTYLELLRVRGVTRVLLSQLLARFPHGMLSIAFLIHVEQVHHSYAAAGLVVAAISLGEAIAGPISSRLMARWGMRPLLSVMTIVAVITLSSMAIFPLSVPALVVLGFIGGCSFPPIQPAVRTIYPKLVPNRLLTPLFSLDASAQEIIWIVGPVLTTFVALRVGSVEAVLAAMAFLAAGGLWFITSPSVGQVRIPMSKRRLGGVLSRPPVIISTLLGLTLVACFAAVEAGIIGLFGEDGPEAGWILAIYALGSLVGGLAWGHREIAPWSMTRRLLLVFAGLAAASLSSDFWWLAVTLFISGLGVAPALTVLFANVSATMKFSETAESYAWIGSGQLIGAGLGSAVAGLCIDHFGAQTAIIAATLFALITAIGALGTFRWSPDLRGGHGAPLPDTGPVETIS